MKLSPDDPKLTAYALGELDKAEAAEVEQELKNAPELREAVEEIRATAEFLKKEFATEEPIALSPKQRDAIASQIPPTNVVRFPKPNVAIFVSISAIAACVMFVLAWGMWFKPARQNALTSGNSEFRYAQNAEQAQRKNSTTQALAKPSPTPVAAKPQPVLPNDAKLKAAELAHDGQLLYEMGKQEEARGKLRESLKQDPNNKAAVYYQNLIKEQAEHETVRRQIARDETVWYESTKTARSSSRQTIPAPSSAAPSRPPALSPEPVVVYAAVGQPAPSEDYRYGIDLPTESPAKTRSFKNEGKLAGGNRHHAVGVTDLSGRKKAKAATDNGLLFGDAYARSTTRSPGNTARYPRYVENSFQSVLNAPLSTVSVDVDTASYANVRRFLNQNQLPPHDAVRIEELVNYFSYNYPQPHGDTPFSVNMEVAGCPWNKQHRLVRVGLKGKEMAQDKRPPSNFVFLIDVSGSMSPSERLPLIKQALRMLVKKMTENDRIAMVVYASSSGVVLDSTSCVNKEKILEAIDRLEAGGSTNGGEGIQRAYRVAEENFIKGGVNRVILATDGDFNVGITDQSALIDLIQKKAKNGVFLTALGVGTDNYKDALMQKLADKGNGNYFYLDTLEEAQKVLIQQMNGTLVTIAKDVKIQIEFNPAQVQSYRLIGYEKRIMEAQDFNNDKKDAGEIGAGHTVTALYEIVPTGVDEETPRPAVDDLKYQSNPARLTPKAERRERRSDDSSELLTLKLRYKKPDGDTSKLLEFPLNDDGKKFSSASPDFRFASAVTSFGMLLKDSQYRGNFGYDRVREVAEGAKGDDKEGYRAEFINLVKKAKTLDRNRE